jgi:4-hydroxy-tetrahydrodipicolinate reductase
MLSNFGWVVPGRLAGMARPRPGQARELRDEGVGAVLVLTESPPLAELEEAGLAVAHEPVPDFAPPDAETLDRCVAFVREHARAGRPVVVHCHAGYGRTGTVLAAVLVAEGFPPEDAIDRVRRLRPGSIETLEQEDAVLGYARRRAGEAVDARGKPTMPTIRVALSGAAGRMGRIVGPALEAAAGIELVARVEKDDDLGALAREAGAHVVVDFTTPAAAAGNARAALAAGCHAVVGTTGLTASDLDDLHRRALAASLGIVVAPNFALGAVLLDRLAAEVARYLPRAEIVEYHHDGKADAPSGTALRTAEAIAAAGGGGGPEGGAPSRGLSHHGVRIHSLRLPGLLAHQEALFGGHGEVLSMRHDVLSREAYVPGVLAAVRAVPTRRGLVRGLEAVLWP